MNLQKQINYPAHTRIINSQQIPTNYDDNDNNREEYIREDEEPVEHIIVSQQERRPRPNSAIHTRI